MLDPAAGAHAGSGDDDAATADMIDRLGLGHAVAQVQSGKITGMRAPFKKIHGFFVEILEVPSKDLGDAGGHGAIDKGHEMRDATFFE